MAKRRAKTSWEPPPHPFVYEINTWPWLHALSSGEGRHVDLASVPDHEWDAIATAGFDAVWLMGVWRRSPAGVAVAMRNAALLANGRDPYFAAWTDVVQLNAFAPELRAAAIKTLRSIAKKCDGVRCDMAMLMMNDTFERTWGERAGPRPADDYWPTVIPAVRE